LLGATQNTETEVNQQRERVKALREKLAGIKSSDARNLLAIADTLVRRACGFWVATGGRSTSVRRLDHVLGSGKN